MFVKGTVIVTKARIFYRGFFLQLRQSLLQRRMFVTGTSDCYKAKGLLQGPVFVTGPLLVTEANVCYRDQ